MDVGDGNRWCRASDPAHPHTLSFRSGPTLSPCFTCGFQGYTDMYSPVACYCSTCDLHFHNQCHLFPRKMRHPYHLQHPLSFVLVKSGVGHLDADITRTLSSSERQRFESDDGFRGHTCDWCGQDLGMRFYRCYVCGFTLDLSCSRRYPLLTISNPNSHEHSLALLPRPLHTPCDACGLIDARDPPYACLQCNYVVHLSCTALPRVIKITRHPHHLSHTPSLRPGKWLCGVCHQRVDFKFGEFSCAKGCPYVVHSKCATHKKVWDGKDLEWEPEEPEDSEDIEPFKKIDDMTIQHFSHEHCLRLNEEGNARDADKQCQACVLPIDYGNFYRCAQCDYILHATCASLPRKKEHALHNHALILDPVPSKYHIPSKCSACRRTFMGFRYKCGDKDSMDYNFNLDVRCASISEPFTHGNHPHPLFIALDDECNSICSACGVRHLQYVLKCIDCVFVMCFHCATLPYTVRYKYDQHLPALCSGEEDASGEPNWCEICEGELDTKKQFYGCEECSVTLHVECIFGPHVYMKAGAVVVYRGREMEIVRNNCSTRPLCHQCNARCRDTVVFKEIDHCFCSLVCVPPKASRYR